jgi:hypothetical protein
MQLEVMEAATVTIQVDPDYKGDKQSAVVPQKLRVDYVDNPQKDIVDLVRPSTCNTGQAIQPQSRAAWLSQTHIDYQLNVLLAP